MFLEICAKLRGNSDNVKFEMLKTICVVDNHDGNTMSIFNICGMKTGTEQKKIKISPTYRWIENGHIFLWLVKDTCWALEFKAGGIFMIFPTVFVAFYILWRSRQIRTEIFHNIAVCMWILANSVWMLGEFFEYDLRLYSALLFSVGLAVLLVYYLFYFRKDRDYSLQ